MVQKEQKRKETRFHLYSKVIGNFQNREKFLVQDISLEGLKLVSNFPPISGTDYTLQITHKDEVMEIKFQVVHVEQAGYNSQDDGIMPPGVLYSVGGKFPDMDERKKRFILSLLYNP